MSELIDSARRVFEIRDSQTHLQPFQILQQRVGRWALEQFGESPLWRTAVGMAEECGELADAVLIPDQLAALDAVADWTIYAFNFCEELRLDFSMLLAGSIFQRQEYIMFSVLRLCSDTGAIAQAILKNAQGIRGFDVFDKVVEQAGKSIGSGANHCRILCQLMGQDYQNIVMDTTEKVLRRNWKKNPTNAADIVASQLK